MLDNYRDNESHLPEARQPRWRWPRYRLWMVFAALFIFSIVLAVASYRAPINDTNLTHLRPLHRIEGNLAYEIAWSPDRERLALVGWESPIQVYDSQTLIRLKTAGPSRQAIHFAFSSDPDIFAYCDNDTVVQVLNARTGEVRKFETECSHPQMDFSPDGKYLVSAGYATEAKVWNVATGKLVHRLDMGGSKTGLRVLYSPDGQTIAVGDRNRNARLFDAQTGSRLHTLPLPESQGMAFHPNSKLLAVAYVDGTFAIYDIASGQMIEHQQSIAEELYQVAWSPDGTLLATSGRQAEIAIWQWDGTQAKKLHTLPNPPEWVIGVAFSPDGKQLVVAGGEADANAANRYVEVWGIPLLGRLWEQ